MVEQTISDELLHPAKRYMKFNRAGLLRGSNVERAQYQEILRRNKIINADEWRADEDMPPLPNGAGQVYENPNTATPQNSATGIAELMQKIYLAVGTVITAEEAREIANRIGADLEMPGPINAPPASGA